VSEPLSSFVAQRQEAWDELTALVDGARGRVHRLRAAQVHRLGRGYRQVVADLAYARRCYPGDPVTVRLEALARRARPLVYGTPAERRSLVWFATTGYWQRVREAPRFLLVAALALLVPTVAVGVWAHGSPAAAVRVAQVSELTAGIAERGPRNPDAPGPDAAVSTSLSTQIFTNNARVALAAFAGGLTAGVLTVVSVGFNGLILGLVAGLAVQRGSGAAFVRLVVPHGVLELSLIVVSASAGLRMGWALLRPGHRSRAEALATEGRAGIELGLGTAFLLVPCGLVEGFVTPRGLSVPAALAVGLGLGALFWGLVVWRGRPTPTASIPTAEPAP
jgi:uncharacterized membrane protein SpoIIM required for sporulation